MDWIGDITICTVVYTPCDSAYSHDDLEIDDLSNIVCGYQPFTSMTDMIIMHMHMCILYVCVHVDGSVDVHVHVDTERRVDHMQTQAHHTSHYRRTITPTEHP